MIGDFLRQRLNELDISYEELAARLTLRGHSVTRQAIGYWIKNRNSPPIEDIEFRVALAAALQMSVNELADHIGFAVSDSQRSEEALRAADMIDQMPERKRLLALGILEKILEND